MKSVFLTGVVGIVLMCGTSSSDATQTLTNEPTYNGTDTISCAEITFNKVLNLNSTKKEVLRVLGKPDSIIKMRDETVIPSPMYHYYYYGSSELSFDTRGSLYSILIRDTSLYLLEANLTVGTPIDSLKRVFPNSFHHPDTQKYQQLALDFLPCSSSIYGGHVWFSYDKERRIERIGVRFLE